MAKNDNKKDDKKDLRKINVDKKSDDIVNETMDKLNNSGDNNKKDSKNDELVSEALNKLNGQNNIKDKEKDCDPKDNNEEIIEVVDEDEDPMEQILNKLESEDLTNTDLIKIKDDMIKEFTKVLNKSEGLKHISLSNFINKLISLDFDNEEITKNIVDLVHEYDALIVKIGEIENDNYTVYNVIDLLGYEKDVLDKFKECLKEISPKSKFLSTNVKNLTYFTETNFDEEKLTKLIIELIVESATMVVNHLKGIITKADLIGNIEFLLIQLNQMDIAS